MVSTKCAFTRLGEESLSTAAGALTGAILAGMYQDGSDTTARLEAAPELFFRVFDALRDYQRKLQPEDLEED